MNAKFYMSLKRFSFFVLLFLLAVIPMLSLTACDDKTIKSNGLEYKDLSTGKGQTAEEGNSVTVNYKGSFEDGSVFDSSYMTGVPITFVVGNGDVIKGFEEGVIGMKEGGKRTITIPPDLAYGAEGNATIPGNATLIFEVELIKVE